MFRSKQSRESGYATVEVLMVMALFVVLGLTMLLLISAGSNTYNKIDHNKNAEIDARNALSYLNIKSRQNDLAGAIAVYTMPETGQNALVIKKTVGNDTYLTWIFLQDGKLWECMVLEGEAPSTRLSFSIVPLTDFSVDLSGQLLELKLAFEYAGEIKEIRGKTYIRSMVGSPI